MTMFIIPENNKWSCLPASFSMACGVSFSKFIDMIGHNGDDRPYVDKSKRRGFHIQECIDVAWQLGFATTLIERYPATIYSYGDTEVCPIYTPEVVSLARFVQYLNVTKRGVLEGIRQRKDGSLAGHACAWDGSLIFDPSHRAYKFEDSEANNFKPIGLMILTEVHHDEED